MSVRVPTTQSSMRIRVEARPLPIWLRTIGWFLCSRALILGSLLLAWQRHPHSWLLASIIMTALVPYGALVQGHWGAFSSTRGYTVVLALVHLARDVLIVWGTVVCIRRMGKWPRLENAIRWCRQPSGPSARA
jgi:hypothetical protein